MVLAESGFGKTTSVGKNDALNIKGLNPEETLIIQSTKKGLPFPGNKKNYKTVGIVERDGVKRLEGNLYFAENAVKAVNIVNQFLKHRPEIKNFVFDDFNFYMQDFYMAESKSKKNQYITFNDIGGQTYDFFGIFDVISEADKNAIVLAHAEIYEDLEHRKRFKMKTIGKMVDQYVTPEGRFEIVLLGKVVFNQDTNTVKKYFVTKDDGIFNAKTPYGMFEDTYINNDLGLVLDMIDKFDNQ